MFPFHLFMSSNKSYAFRDRSSLNEAKSKFDAAAWLEKRGIPTQKSQHRITISCPIGTHSDSTPSFSLKHYTSGWGWKCFGCGETGDVVTLVKIVDKCPDTDAIIEVHKFSGVPMPEYGKGARGGYSSSKGRDRTWRDTAVNMGQMPSNKRSGYRGSGGGASAGHGSAGNRSTAPTRSQPYQKKAPSHATSSRYDDAYYEALAQNQHWEDDPYGDYDYDPHGRGGERASRDEEFLLEVEEESQQNIFDPYEENDGDLEAPEILVPQRVIHPHREHIPDLYEQLKEAGKPIFVSEEMARRFEVISDGDSERLQRMCYLSRLRDEAELLNLWLDQRGWSKEVASRTDIHIAARTFQKQRLKVVRHPFYGWGHRTLGWSDRVQTADRRRTGISQRWLANAGATPPLVGAHSLDGQYIAMVAEGVSDWVTVTDNAPQGVAPLCVPGTSHKDLAAREIVALLRGRHVVVFGDRDKSGAGMLGVLSAAAQSAYLKVIWAAPDDGDLSDLLSTSARTHNPYVARMALRANLRELVNQVLGENLVSGSRWRLKLP